MSHKRNISGLLKAAKQRRQDIKKRVEQTITYLLKENKAINFNSISKYSGVGKPWLYKEIQIRKKIEILRQQTQAKKMHRQPKQSQQASYKSKDNIIMMLKERIKLLSLENKKLKEQVEVLYGEIYTSTGVVQ